MGSSQTKDIEINFLKTQNRLLIRNNLENAVDPSIRRQINMVKTTKTYTNLILSGGDIKTLAHIGAMSKLSELGILDKITNIGCSGIGSIIGSLFAVGYNPNEIKEIIMSLDTQKLADIKKGLVTDLYKIVASYGASPGGYLVEFIGNLIKRRTGNADYTLKNLWDDRKIVLVITGTDLNTKNTISLWHGSDPDLPIRHAVRMSMSIPYKLQPVQYKTYFIVAGGLLDNCPEHMFDGDFPGDPLAELNLTKPNPYTLALDVLGLMDGNTQSDEDISSPEKYSAALLNTLFSGNETRYMRPCYWMRTVGIYTPNYPMTRFKLNGDEKTALMNLGYNSCSTFFV